MPDLPSGAPQPTQSPLSRRMTGRLLLVQGMRFVLVGDNSVAKQFQLAHGAGIEPQDLPPLLHDRRRITVEYRQTADLWADTAIRILPDATA